MSGSGSEERTEFSFFFFVTRPCLNHLYLENSMMSQIEKNAPHLTFEIC